LALTAGDNVLRLLPPLIVSEAEIGEAIDILHKVAREWSA
jgi:4-aminobutyrate aminotransferase-like enzyme